MVATVESCTGGQIAHQLTNVSGASRVFFGGWVVYHNLLKRSLGVTTTLLRDFGAVSPEVAIALAETGLHHMQKAFSVEEARTLSDVQPKNFICLSTTGIAGPEGGSSQKPVGTCFMGIAFSDKSTCHLRFEGPSSYPRTQMKSAFVNKALHFLSENI